jgi:hypothetical protein
MALAAPEQAGAPEAKPALERSLAQALQAASTLQAAGPGAGYASQLLVQAELLAMAGQAESGLAALDRALAWMERTGMRAQEAEVWRMRGELLLLADRPVRSTGGEAETCFQRALEVARQQQARWLELRAAVSLARLWQPHRREAARTLLAGVYNWFTEGFDLADLAEARALLAQLE